MKKSYIAPSMDVVEVVVDNSILVASILIDTENPLEDDDMVG